MQNGFCVFFSLFTNHIIHLYKYSIQKLKDLNGEKRNEKCMHSNHLLIRIYNTCSDISMNDL